MKRLALASALACTVVMAQPESPPRADDNAADVYLRLRETRESREIGRIGTLRSERMVFVEDEHAEISAARAHAVLKHESGHIRAILDASRLERFEIAPAVPVDPYTGDATGDRPYTDGAAAIQARTLSYAAVHYWAEKDYDGAAVCAAGILRIARQLSSTNDYFHAGRGSTLLDMASTLMEQIIEAAEAAPEPIRLSPKTIGSLRDALDGVPEHDPCGLLVSGVASTRLNAEWLRASFVNEQWSGSYPDFVRHYDRSRREQEEFFRRQFSPELRPVEQIEGNDPAAAFEQAMNMHWNSLPEEERRDISRQMLGTFDEAEWGILDSYPQLLPDDPPLPTTAGEIRDRLDIVGGLLERLGSVATREDAETELATLWAEVERDRTQVARVACGFARGHRHSWRYSLKEHARTRELIDRLARLGE